ncbi:MAG: phosphate-starvation-inducible PsiE family protein [Verrucomicrobiota bacterium]
MSVVKVEKTFRKFEHVIVLSLLGMMMVAVLVSTIELGVVLAKELLKPPFLLLNIDEMLEVFGFFLMVLIGLELLETIKVYLEEDRVHAEVVFLVALVAVSRKVVILDYEKATTDMLYGMAALVIALGVGYYLVRRALTDFSMQRKRKDRQSS